MYDDLFEPVRVGDLDCRNRIVMPACTRCGCPDHVPTPAVARYYRRRAQDGVGLIITEGAAISLRANGYPGVPGIWSDRQVEAWRAVTDAVHDEGGLVLCQLWHVGAFGHPLVNGGRLPEGPSGVSPAGYLKQIRAENGALVPYGPTETMTEGRIRDVIEEFGRAAENALRAGFDGVEIHGAHGYLIDQFINLHWNRREDSWGGPDRCRFAGEVARAVSRIFGPSRTVFRFSPVSTGGARWKDDRATFDLLLDTLWLAGVRVLHASHESFDEPVLPLEHGMPPTLPLHEAVRRKWEGKVIGVGGLTPALASAAISRGEVDMVAFGRGILANPDFVSRVRNGLPLRAWDPRMTLIRD